MKTHDFYNPSFAEFDTQDASPFKKSSPQVSSATKPSHLYSNLTTQPQTSLHSKKVSRTQQEIYSHELITSIMNKRQNNTVIHNVGQFDPNMQLYGKPKNPEEYGMLEFSDQRQMYQSEYSKRINEINRKLNCGKSLSERVKSRKDEDAVSTTFYNKPKRPVSANPKTAQPTHNKISVSGLVSYNFNSVNARKTLGYDFQRDEDKLSNILTKLQSKNKCCVTRQHSLIEKKKHLKAKKQGEVKQAIMCDFDTKTRKFLDNLHEEITQQQMVYGMKWEKLLCIKELMEKEGLPYPEAEAIVNEIQEKKQFIQHKDIAKKREHNDQSELNNRRQVVQRNRVMLKHLYFMD